jgi:hypothetical protein
VKRALLLVSVAGTMHSTRATNTQKIVGGTGAYAGFGGTMSIHFVGPTTTKAQAARFAASAASASNRAIRARRSSA